MSLGLQSVRTKGRARRRDAVNVVRSMTADDLASLEEEKGQKPSPLRRITGRHKKLARLLAGGSSVTEVAFLTGYTVSTVSIIKDDPSVKELIAHYQAGKDEAFQDAAEAMANLSFTSINELNNRLEEDPDGMSTGQLIELAKMASDRSGLAPNTGTTNVNINIGSAERVKEAREKAMAATIARQQGKVIEHDPNE